MAAIVGLMCCYLLHRAGLSVPERATKRPQLMQHRHDPLLEGSTVPRVTRQFGAHDKLHRNVTFMAVRHAGRI